MAAGFETTSHAITWCLTMLVRKLPQATGFCLLPSAFSGAGDNTLHSLPQPRLLGTCRGQDACLMPACLAACVAA